MRELSFAALSLLLAVPALGAELAAPAAPQTPPDLRTLAQKLVAESARVGEGDYVLITGTFEDRELLEELAVAVRRLGGNPLVMVDSDAMVRRFFTEVPEKYDGQAGAVRARLAQTIDVRIRIDRGETYDATGAVPAARVARAMESYEAANATETRRSVRRVVLGNGLFPTEQNARRHGVSVEQLSRLFWDGIAVDVARMQATGDKARAALAGGKVLELTAANGTRLKMRVEGRPVMFSDGVISADEQKKGGASSMVWLPAGEVYLVPVPGTAEGTLVIDRQVVQGTEVTGLRMVFKAGKIVAMTAKTNLEVLKAEYDAAPPGKEVFGLIDLGVNPNVKVPAGSKMLSYLPAGMIMVSIGGNGWAGGENHIFYTLQSFLPEATLKIDGKVVVDRGLLKL